MEGPQKDNKHCTGQVDRQAHDPQLCFSDLLHIELNSLAVKVGGFLILPVLRSVHL